MRVVFACVPAYGHLHPLLPLALACAQNGDDVVIATGPELCRRAEAVGLATQPVGTGLWEWWPELARRAGGEPGDGLPPDRILGYFIPRLFAEIAAQSMIDGLVDAAKGADLLVFESYTFAGPLAAAIAGIPAVHHLLGPAPPLEAMELGGDAVSPLWRTWKHDPQPYGSMYRVPTLNICPPVLGAGAIPGGTEVIPLRPVPLDATGSEQLPAWVDDLPARPTIYVTLGTVTNRDTSIFTAVLDGLADEPVNVVITVGETNDPAMLGELPANARAERYIPQSVLLPRCDAVITHGGSGTMLSTLAHGLPHLMIPQGADQYVNAAVCLKAGVAHRLLPDEVAPRAVRELTRSMLRDPSMGGPVVVARDEIEALPPPGDVAGWLRRHTSEPD
jgi:UDP:flavonoid glycosyltransferase YjiC (YdhE family)